MPMALCFIASIIIIIIKLLTLELNEYGRFIQKLGADRNFFVYMNFDANGR